MRRFPSEFADFLNARGRRVLERSVGMAGPFVSLQGLIDARRAREAAALLERALGTSLQVMEDPIPPGTITEQTENYTEQLPKTVRVRTALMASRRSKAYRRAEDIGLVQMMRSESMRTFAQHVVGARLKRRWGIQVLCYGHGDYSGPHTDHHPEDPEARDGYVDLHVTLCNSGVEHQWLVYARDGHFSELVSTATDGGITCYQLPFWHFTTPLWAKHGHEASARRWLLLSTFLFEGATVTSPGAGRPARRPRR